MVDSQVNPNLRWLTHTISKVYEYIFVETPWGPSLYYVSKGTGWMGWWGQNNDNC